MEEPEAAGRPSLLSVTKFGATAVACGVLPGVGMAVAHRRLENLEATVATKADTAQLGAATDRLQALVRTVGQHAAQLGAATDRL